MFCHAGSLTEPQINFTATLPRRFGGIDQGLRHVSRELWSRSPVWVPIGAAEEVAEGAQLRWWIGKERGCGGRGRDGGFVGVFPLSAPENEERMGPTLGTKP